MVEKRLGVVIIKFSDLQVLLKNEDWDIRGQEKKGENN